MTFLGLMTVKRHREVVAARELTIDALALAARDFERQRDEARTERDWRVSVVQGELAESESRRQAIHDRLQVVVAELDKFRATRAKQIANLTAANARRKAEREGSKT